MTFELSPLPYSYDALNPVMSETTLHLHHDKHHQAYVTNLNNLIKGTEFEGQSLKDIVRKSFGNAATQGIFNNAGQHWNHILFWNCMKPKGGGAIPSELETKIIEDFGSVDKFKEDFTQAGVTQFGSGWAWLVMDQTGKLSVMKTANAENPIVHGKKVLLGCDVWEHSYYVDYQNRRPDYLKAFLNDLINWEYVATRYIEQTQAL
ncbi:MAG: superoxide dismutase [Alphaproteobacteria bacterium]|jgi:Fe-Mn family superoxide dismutase|nr:superoxide dismutase [Alphaproteobacteria bacterium]MBP9877613.1 superoxide dismutase [Alphaproteobacteria bacterium]